MVKDKEKIDTNRVENIEKVQGAFFNAGQFQIIFGTGTVTLYTIDATTPEVKLKNIKDPLQVKELISDLSVRDRRESGLMEFA